ncbi:tetratricopeptide repeat protein [Actinoplanes teichomyceticus]|uniref:Tetratricopeptide repeat protein n=1 Tax=Actinoplanes teichomyceticus TaxID=1867 RepID=A0A561VM64_ACTTI|nr:tetratricopeptide repeat protein [Actinoplanes teichomyceticus]TWG12719.1 tetratricopeptide repeat protein [Actinoplanes teichomyceticus]GIF13452.1 tetratricopeptide repeat protein [Actinoplanes teichomyceticus]
MSFRKPGTQVSAGGLGAIGIGGDNSGPLFTNATVVIAPRQVSWPVRVGPVPPAASAFQPRQALRERIETARRHGDDVVLGQPGPARPATRILAGGGGVGKTQVAAWFAREHATDLVVWVAAVSTDHVITEYARAARRVGAPGADGADAGADAAAFLDWLRGTDRSWLVVLDDIADPADVTGWWPPQHPNGWTLATTRRRDAALASASRQRIDVDVYDPQESQAYLTQRLTEVGLAHLLDGDVAGLAQALGHLPLALSHAAAYLINEEESCGAYLARFTGGRERLAELMPADSDPDDYGRPVSVTLLLALEAADRASPAGLARPALALAALCDPAGHPETLWRADAVVDHLTSLRGEPVSADQAHRALRLLHRYGLLHHTGADPARSVRIHALTARAARETIVTDPDRLARTVADALVEIWPEDDYGADDLGEVLRANAGHLQALAPEALWADGVHDLVPLIGLSLFRAGRHTPGIAHWEGLVEQARARLGDEHIDTLSARGNLAGVYWQAGRTADAIALLERVAGDCARLLAADHPAVLVYRSNLATSYRQAGRYAEAVALQEQVIAEYRRRPDTAPADTLVARANLGVSYGYAGRTDDGVRVLEEVVAEREHLLGPTHPDTLKARVHLATLYRDSGRLERAIAMQEGVLAEQETRLGARHRETVITRSQLGTSYWRAGRLGEAIAIEEQVLAQHEELLGADHPATLLARDNLAVSYVGAGLTEKGTALLQKVAGDRTRVLGPAHPDTLTTLGNLANAYATAGRIADAFRLIRIVTAGRERVLGPKHPQTLTARAELAACHWHLGRTPRATALLRRVVADREEVLGPGHEDTRLARACLLAWTGAEAASGYRPPAAGHRGR